MTVVSYRSEAVIARLRDLHYRLRERIDVVTDQRDRARQQTKRLKEKVARRDETIRLLRAERDVLRRRLVPAETLAAQAKANQILVRDLRARLARYDRRIKAAA